MKRRGGRRKGRRNRRRRIHLAIPFPLIRLCIAAGQTDTGWQKKKKRQREGKEGGKKRGERKGERYTLTNFIRQSHTTLTLPLLRAPIKRREGEEKEGEKEKERYRARSDSSFTSIICCCVFPEEEERTAKKGEVEYGKGEGGERGKKRRGATGLALSVSHLVLIHSRFMGGGGGGKTGKGEEEKGGRGNHLVQEPSHSVGFNFLFRRGAAGKNKAE